MCKVRQTFREYFLKGITGTPDMRLVIERVQGKYVLPPLKDRLAWREHLWGKCAELIGEEMRKKRYQAKIRSVYLPDAIEDVVEPYIGIKTLWPVEALGTTALRTEEHAPFLYSRYNAVRWDSRSIVAQCTMADASVLGGASGVSAHPAEWTPYPKCSCGIYAYKKDHIPVSFWDNANETLGVPVEVRMGGIVIPHTSGYRAQIAVIDKILVPVNSAGRELGQRKIPRQFGSLGQRHSMVTYIYTVAEFYNVPVVRVPIKVPRFTLP